MSEKATSDNVRVLHEFDTGFYADSVEWCPASGHQNILACGTYQLLENIPKEENPENIQIRLGRLFLFKTKKVGAKYDCVPIQDIDMPGILDMKWSNYGTGTLLGVANSVGEIILLTMTSSPGEDDLHDVVGGDVSLLFNDKISIRDDGDLKTLSLSLDWSNRLRENCASVKIAASDSKGRLSIVDVDTSRVSHSFPAHDFEAWVCAFDCFQPEIIYSGGDDMKFKRWDLRMDIKASGATHTNSKAHTAGVCSLQLHPFRDHILASGSYDENVLIWDTRNFKRPLSETNVGGGVWRLKWRPNDGRTLLCGCMHGGAHVLDFGENCFENEGKMTASYHGHPTITYGADFNHINSSIIATAAFYDHEMHIWEINELTDAE